MSKFNGDKIKMEVWGESHSKDIGVILNGIEFDGEISIEQIQEFVNRRRAKKQAYSTTRLEEDVVIFESGIENG
ncbi:MAG: chorismate synthase, partial [Clostridia bacterium]